MIVSFSESFLEHMIRALLMQICIVTTSQTPQCEIYFLQIGEQEWWYYTMGEDLFVCSDQNVIQFRIWSAKIK